MTAVRLCLLAVGHRGRPRLRSSCCCNGDGGDHNCHRERRGLTHPLYSASVFIRTPTGVDELIVNTGLFMCVSAVAIVWSSPSARPAVSIVDRWRLATRLLAVVSLEVPRFNVKLHMTMAARRMTILWRN